MSSIFVKFAFCVFILPSVLTDQESTTINIEQQIKNEIVGVEDLLNKIENLVKTEKKYKLGVLKGELLGLYKAMAKQIIGAEKKVGKKDEKIWSLCEKIGYLKEDLARKNVLLNKLLLSGKVQSKLALLKNLCDDARKGQTAEETWLNILHESKSPHSMALRYRIDSCGLTYEIFAQYAQTFEQDINVEHEDINFLRHPEYFEKFSKQEVEEVIKSLQVEESLTKAIEVILIPFPKSTPVEIVESGPFATFECVEFFEVPEGVSIGALKNAIFTLNDNEKELIQAKTITKDDGKKSFTGEVVMCFKDHDTAFKFWFHSDPLKIQVSDKENVRIGFRPILYNTKESLFPSPSNK